MPTDFDSSLPVRTQNNGDVVTFLADATTPSQLAAVDSFGSQNTIIRDAAGDAIGSQLISASYWLQVVTPGNGPAQPGTASNFSVLAGGIYNATPPTLTDGQQSSLQLDSNGRLLVDADFNFTSDTNYGTVGSNTLRTAAQIGNATGAADFNWGTVGAQTLRVAAEIGNAAGSADFNAGATGAQTLRVSANQGAPNTISNAWPIEITDGTHTVSVTATGELKVDITQPLPAGTNSIGTVNVSNLPTTVDTNYGTVGASTIRTAAQIGNSSGAADFNNGATGAQTLRVAANLAVAGANVSATNPVPVTIEDAPGSHINDFKDASTISAGSSDNHDYTVTAGKTLHLTQVEGAGSGKARMQVSIETGVATGIFNIEWVMFNSTGTPNMSLHIDNDIQVAAGVRVRVVMQNRDLASQDLYSTISGYEV